VGIVIWEALAGRALFLGESDYETVKRVQKADVQSLRNFNNEVDENLDRLLMKSMARDRDQRFQTAREMGDAIAEYLFRHQMKVTSYDVGNMVQMVCRREQPRARAQGRHQHHRPAHPGRNDGVHLARRDERPARPGLGARCRRPTVAQKPQPRAGAQPLDAGSFNEKLENPADWFAEEEDQATAFFDRKSLEPDDPLRVNKSDPSELAALLEKDDTGQNKMPRLPPDGSHQDLVKMLERELATVGAPAEASRRHRPRQRRSVTSLQPRNSLAGGAMSRSRRRRGGLIVPGAARS
jgi:serine/threonine-protein kinase